MFFRLIPNWILDLFLVVADWTVDESARRDGDWPADEPIPYAVTADGAIPMPGWRYWEPRRVS